MVHEYIFEGAVSEIIYVCTLFVDVACVELR